MFIVGEVLGSGSYGRVISCQEKDREEVAVKVVEKTPGIYSRYLFISQIQLIKNGGFIALFKISH